MYFIISFIFLFFSFFFFILLLLCRAMISISEFVDCNNYLLAIDTAADTALVTINESADDAQHSLQDAVTSAATWLTDWHLLVNATKTVVMSFQRQQRLQITINGTLLQQVSSHRHLGLIIQADLRWSDHVGAKIKKGSARAFFSSCGVSATRFINQHWSVCIQSTYDQYWNMDHSCFPVCPRRLTTDWRASNGMLDVSAWVFLYSSLPTTALSSTTHHYLPSLPAVNTDN